MTRDHLLRILPAELQRLTGRRYAIKLEQLDDDSLQELRRLVRDAQEEKNRLERDVRMGRLW
ncbi:MAG: hypothetical protein H6716_24770 [Polyangiaceae bacterium]|nr:hypothetical protein [Polyangiaceae bacterium]